MKFADRAREGTSSFRGKCPRNLRGGASQDQIIARTGRRRRTRTLTRARAQRSKRRAIRRGGGTSERKSAREDKGGDDFSAWGLSDVMSTSDGERVMEKWTW